MNSSIHYFLYTRKSTDELSRQVRSIAAQSREGHQLASQHKLDIYEEFPESRTAKLPGRPIFNEMIRRIKKGEAHGIIAWHPNRLARNALDAGTIIDLLDRGTLRDLRFASYNFNNTPEGRMMLYVTFAQSAYEVDKLSVDVKRGLSEKAMQGEYPGQAPTGYLNDKATKLMIPDPQRFALTRELFQKYSTGSHSLRSLSEAMANRGLRSRNGKTLGISSIEHIIKNPFYYGHFLYNGELHPGIHKPLISKSLFDRCQTVIRKRCHPMKPTQRYFAFRNLARCGECHAAITSEIQKGHVYYRCTKKKGACLQLYIREESLDAELSRHIAKFALAQTWTDRFLEELDEAKQVVETSAKEERSRLKAKLNAIKAKLDTLLDARLDGEISKEEFTAKKNSLLRLQVDMTEQLKALTNKPLLRLEPVRDFILICSRATEIHSSQNLSQKREFLQNLGSNLVLLNRRVEWPGAEKWKPVVDSGFFGPHAFPSPTSEKEYIALRPRVLRVLEEIRTNVAGEQSSECPLQESNLDPEQ